MNELPKLWIVAERPVRLPNALIAAESLLERFPGGIRFVRDDSDAWQHVQWQRYSHYFGETFAFPRVKEAASLLDLSRFYRETTARKRDFAALPINPMTDALLCIAGVLGLSAVAASAHPKVFRVLSISAGSYERLTRTLNPRQSRFTTAGWFQNRFVEPLAGVERTLHLRTRGDAAGDGTRLVRLQRNPLEIFDHVILSSISGTKLPETNSRLTAARYPSLGDLSEFSNRSTNVSVNMPRVIFFGTPFLAVRNLEPNVYLAHANACLDFIRRNFSEHDLIYRPHPIETKESEQLNLEKFRIENDREPAELYLLEHFSEIAAVFSVSSTVSRRALTFGLNGYSFWRCFPFPQRAAEFFEKLMGDVPSEFEIRDLTQPPIAYQASRSINPASRSYADALKLGLDQRSSTLSR